MRPITKCRACGSSKLQHFLDLGSQYLSDFRDDDSRPPKYPLVALLCEDCKLVQLEHTTPQAEMYHERYGFKSGISDSIKKDLDDAVTHAFQYVNNPRTWLDIASNDGSLLKCVPTDIYRVGVDPVTFLCKEAEQYADIIVNDYFTADSVGGQYQVITSISCFYDMPDPSKFVKDVEEVLAPGGIWLIQQNYLLSTMQLSAVDNFCHEHIEYYTLLSLENLLSRFDLEVNEVQISGVNGGSIRTIVSRKGDYAVDPSVRKQRLIEKSYGLDSFEAYEQFANNIHSNLGDLRKLIEEINIAKNRVVILAASTRGATIWQAIKLGPATVGYAVERNPAKIGRRFSAIDIPIKSEEFFRKDNPEYAIIGPWFYGEEIAERERDYVMNGGHLIVPLPEVKILTKENVDEYIGNLASHL